MHKFYSIYHQDNFYAIGYAAPYTGDIIRMHMLTVTGAETTRPFYIERLRCNGAGTAWSFKKCPELKAMLLMPQWYYK